MDILISIQASSKCNRKNIEGKSLTNTTISNNIPANTKSMTYEQEYYNYTLQYP